MSPRERLRWATAPDQRRSTALLWGGLCVLLAAGGLATGFEAPRLVSSLLYLALLAGWFIAGCGMVGYVRWFFRQSAEEAREHFPPPRKEK